MLSVAAALVAPLAAPLAAGAQVGHAIDPANDFIPSYTGPQTPDLDVREVWFTFDGATFQLRSRQGGPIDPTSGHLFVWGVNRGQGSAGFQRSRRACCSTRCSRSTGRGVERRARPADGVLTRCPSAR
jgi:hypothetical protein